MVILEIQVKYGGWTRFYPILFFDMEGGADGDIIDQRPLSQLDNKIYGRYIGGKTLYGVWWNYESVEKSRLREISFTGLEDVD